MPLKFLFVVKLLGKNLTVNSVDGVDRERMSDSTRMEIESISILKDASATAVFGIRGANGVIYDYN
jgi:TonB-dependent SusC/RagA subfamily outer membrane receptor